MASDNRMNMPDAGAPHDHLIDSVLDDKRRLGDQEERLWREMQKAIHERDQEIAKLKRVILRLIKGQYVHYSGEVPPNTPKRPVSGGPGTESPQVAQECNDDLDSSAKRRRMLSSPAPESKQLYGTTACDPSIETFQTDSQVPEVDRIIQRFTRNAAENILPIIQTTPAGHQQGVLNRLATSVRDSIHSSLVAIQRQQRPAYPRGEPSHRCGHCWAFEWRKCRWTLDSAEAFACLSCASSKRACLRRTPTGKWHVLPVPVALRGEDTSYNQAGFYIYAGSEDISKFRYLWEK